MRFGFMMMLLAVLVLPTAAQRRPTATPTETVIDIGEPVEGRLEDAIHTYTFNARAQQVIVFDLKSDDFDPYLQIEAADGDVLASDDDSGDGLYSRVVFVAPEAGVYAATVRAFAGNATGSYLLLSSEDVSQLMFDEPVVVTVKANSTSTIFFVGEAGQYVTITGEALVDDLDTALRLTAADGSDVAYNDDFTGLDPSLYRVELPITGLYTLSVTALGSGAGDVRIVLMRDELPIIGADGITMRLGREAAIRDVVGVEVERGKSYLITVMADEIASANLDLYAPRETYAASSLYFTDSQEVSMVYRATATGVMRLELRDSSYSGMVSYTVTVSEIAR